MFIKEYSGGEPVAPTLCLTATAKPEVIGEISAILKAIRNLDNKQGKNREVVATAGEIVKEEKDYEFVRDTMRDEGFTKCRPDIVDRLIRGIAADGKDESDSSGSLQVSKISREVMTIKLQRNWNIMEGNFQAGIRGKGTLQQFEINMVESQQC